MMLPHLTKLLAPLLLFVITIIALPAPPPTLGNAVTTPCQSEYARCLRHNHNVDFCRNFVCSYYGDKCTSCQARDFTDFTDLTAIEPTSENNKVAVQEVGKREFLKPPLNSCIIVCVHAWCRPLCINPSYPPSGSTADMIEPAVIANTTDLLATTNAQPDKLGIPLRPGMTTVVLGQKDNDGKTEKCAWFCSPDTLSCEETCWVPEGTQDAAVTSGGFLSEDDSIEGLADCQIVDKDEVGRLIVCAVPELGRGDNVGVGDKGMDGMRCILFWRERKPHLACRKV